MAPPEAVEATGATFGCADAKSHVSPNVVLALRPPADVQRRRTDLFSRRCAQNACLRIKNTCVNECMYAK